MAKVENKKDKRKEAGGLFIPAGLFLGFAYGLMNGNMLVGLYGGLGLGFLLFAIVSVFRK